MYSEFFDDKPISRLIGETIEASLIYQATHNNLTNQQHLFTKPPITI
jgi:hypothetical protein